MGAFDAGFPARAVAAAKVNKHYSEWGVYKIITATTSAEVVPANVNQIWVHCWGGGAASNGTIASGAGAGYASGIIDVIPGQLLPTITIGAGGSTASGAGGSSSLGTLLTATGGNGLIAGSGSAAANVSNVFTASGGAGGSIGTLGGSSPGSPYGNGLSAASYSGAGVPNIGYQALNSVVSSIHSSPLLQFLNKSIIYSASTQSSYPHLSQYSPSGIGFGASASNHGHMFSGGSQAATSYAGYGAGGAMHSSTGFNAGGNGVVILVYSE